MKSKKIFSMTVAIAMIGSLLTGCTGDKKTLNNNGQVTIKYATYSAGPDHIQDLEKMINKFEEQNKDINVEYEIIGYDNYFTKLQTQASSKTLPDVFELNYENFINYAQNGVLLNLNKHKENDGDFKEEDLLGNSYDYFKYDENLYGLVEKFSNVVLYYNKDLFDKAGINYPDEKWDWAKELEVGKEFKKQNIYSTYSPVQYTEMYKTIAQNGGSLFDKNNKLTINSKENIEAVNWMIDKINKENIQPTPKQMSGKTPEEMFKNGEIAMLRTGSWMFETFKDTSFEWDIALEPGNKNKVHHIFADGIVGSKTTKNPEAVWKFIKFMSVDPTATKIRLESNWDLPASSDENVKKIFLEKEKPENREVIFQALDTGIMPPAINKATQVQDIINKELNQALIGSKSVEDALNNAQNLVEKVLK